MAARKERVEGLWSLGQDPEMKALATIAVPKLLTGFPPSAKAEHLKSWLDPLLKGLLSCVPPGAALSLVQQKLDSGITAPQRVYWLACGMLLTRRGTSTSLSLSWQITSAGEKSWETFSAATRAI
jgi:hypothetical protein